MRGIGIALDENFDLKINPVRDANGMIVSGVVLERTLPQNQAVILMMQPGELKEAPTVGCGIANMINDYDPALWRKKIKMQMEMDGQTIDAINFYSNGKLQIDGQYS